MPINATPQYYKAYGEYLEAYTTEERIEKLKKAIALAPKHKGSENLLGQLRSRLSKLKKELVKEKTKKKGSIKGIKKTGHAQAVIIGKENSGKSSLLSALTNASPKISEIPFTTMQPEIGTLDLGGIKVQLIEMPATADNQQFSIVHGANLIIILINSLNELIYWANFLKERKIMTKKIVVFNKIDISGGNELKRIENLKDIIKISAKNKIGLEELKKRIFENLDLIKIYTKEPGRKSTIEPIVLKKNSQIKDMAEKIRMDFVKRFKSAKVWGTSVKFPGQRCGIEHVLHDNDIVELYIR